MITITLNSKNFLKFNFLIITGFVILHLISELIISEVDTNTILYAIKIQLSLHSERNLPTFYAGCLLIISSLLLLLLRNISKRKYERRLLLLMSTLASFLSFDEMFMLHEHIAKMMRLNENFSTPFNVDWIIPYSILSIFSFLIGKRFLLSQPIEIKRLLILSASIYIFGELGLEILEDIIKSDIFLIPKNYIYLSSFFEETLGLIGITLLNYTLLKMISHKSSKLQLNIL
tara:strand:+ start:7344 stop:8036 length:693 start_codon:yes stop_codon:yes gene_type:complete